MPTRKVQKIRNDFKKKIKKAKEIFKKSKKITWQGAIKKAFK